MSTTKPRSALTRAEINRQIARKPRISKQLRRAIEAMVWEGLPRDDAAERAGMRPHSLYKALRKTHVKSLYAQEHATFRDGEALRAFNRQVNLAEDSPSHDVRERANRWIAGCGGLAPVQKVAVQAHHTHAFAGIGFAEPVTIDAEAEHVADAELVGEGEGEGG